MAAAATSGAVTVSSRSVSTSSPAWPQPSPRSGKASPSSPSPSRPATTPLRLRQPSGSASTLASAASGGSSAGGAYGGIDRSGVPDWVRVLEDGAKSDEELLEIMNGTQGDPREIEERIRQRFHERSEEYLRLGSGISGGPLQVSFREFDPFDVYVWLEFFTRPSEKEQELLEEVFKSWFVIGRLGGYNADNLQVQDGAGDISYMEYDHVSASNTEPAWFHNMASFEYKDNWGRCWFDLGTGDTFGLDVLINSLTTFSVNHVGIKQLVIGGMNEDWKERTDDEVDDDDDDDLFTDNVWAKLYSPKQELRSGREDYDDA